MQVCSKSQMGFPLTKMFEERRCRHTETHILRVDIFNHKINQKTQENFQQNELCKVKICKEYKGV